jgi:hypothetical protein
VGLLDTLLGRRKLKDARGDKLFALSTARVTLEGDLGIRPGGVAAIVFKPMSAAEFVRAENELQALLDAVAQGSGSRLRRKSDEYGYEWLVVEDPELEDLVTTAHLVASELKARGFGPQLLAAIFKFEEGDQPVYWIYSFKRGTFWPFVPTGEGQERDNPKELELKAKLERELPIEPDLTRWFGMFDAPLDAPF